VVSTIAVLAVPALAITWGQPDGNADIPQTLSFITDVIGNLP